MKKHYLVTISNDVDNLFGVRFLCSFFKKESEHQITLLHVCRLDAADMNQALMEMWDHPDERVEGRLTIGARKALDKSVELIGASRMSIDQMVTKTALERYGKFRDIINESTKGLYDAIIMGKRASYTLQWLFERSADEIAQSIIKDSRFSIPLWVCPNVEADRKNVLVCVDGSENGYRAVDHVGYILTRQDQHNITLFHVKNGTAPESQEIFSRSEKILRGHGIADERIETHATWGFSVPGTILGKIDRERYAAAAIGLHGHEEGLLKSFNLAGGTASALIEKIENASLWCCP